MCMMCQDEQAYQAYMAYLDAKEKALALLDNDSRVNLSKRDFAVMVRLRAMTSAWSAADAADENHFSPFST